MPPLNQLEATRARGVTSNPNLPALTPEFDERPLRIALVTEYYYPHLGGVCEHVHFFAREARRRGHHVDIITSHLPGVPERPNVVRVGRSQTVYANGSQARITLGFGLRKEMRRTLRDGRYDVVHVHSPYRRFSPCSRSMRRKCPSWAPSIRISTARSRMP